MYKILSKDPLGILVGLDMMEERFDVDPYNPLRMNIIKILHTSKFKLLPLVEVADFKKNIVTSKKWVPDILVEQFRLSPLPYPTPEQSDKLKPIW